MKNHYVTILVTLLVNTGAIIAQPGNPNWIGVWQAQLDGLPSVVLTLAKDNGTLEGTLVLSIITRDDGAPHIVAHEAHVLMRTRTQGDSLTFQVKRIDRSDDPMEFAIQQISPNSATIHCLNCGGAPTVEMSKLD